MRINFAMTTLLLTVAIVSQSNVASCQTVAFVDATIETADKAGSIDEGIMVVDGDTIVDVGKDVAIPDDAQVVSLRGKFIMPGVVDPYYVFSSSGASQAFRTITFRGRTIRIPIRPTSSPTTFTKMGEYFYPFNYSFKSTVRTGITTAQLVSSGRGLSAFAEINGESTPEILFQKDGLLFAVVTNQTSSLDLIRKPLADQKTASSKTASSKTSSTKTSSTSSSASSKAAAETKALWADVKSGKKRLFLNLNSSAAVAHVLKVAKAHPKVKFVLVATGPNLYQLIDQLKSMKNVSVILQPGFDTVPYSRDLMNVSKILSEHNIPFALSMSLSRSQMTSNQDDPMFPIANLVHTGVDRSVAIKAITIKPAELMGIEKTHGSLAKDKRANFLIFDADPLQTGSKMEQVFLNGKKIHEN